jgi:hypothetical protein
MEFKLKAGDVLAAEQAINELSKIKMRGAYGISVARLLKCVTKAANKVRDNRLEIVKKHGTLQDGGQYKVKEGHELDLEKEGKSLLDEEVCVRGNPLPRGIDEIEVEPKVWLGLLPFLQEEVDRKKKEEKDECSDE